MEAYKLYERDQMGYEGNIIYIKNYSKAIELFNQEVKNAVYEVKEDMISIDDFRDKIKSFKEWSRNEEIISRKFPYLLYKKNKSLVAEAYYWQNTSYDHNEPEIFSLTVILEEIEIVEQWKIRRN